MSEAAPFGAAEIVEAVAGARRVLDAGCGGGRLTVMLAQAGAAVTGIDTNAGQLDEAGRRASTAGVELTLLEADFNVPLPFADGSFDAVTSRLSVMAADDPVATLRELHRVLGPGGRIVTVVWAAAAENPWFAEPRAAIGTVLGPERAAFARAFGKLGDPPEVAAAHREAGFDDVEVGRLSGVRTAPNAAAYWAQLADENGHFRRIRAALSDLDQEKLILEIETRLVPFSSRNGLLLPRMLTVVTARR